MVQVTHEARGGGLRSPFGSGPTIRQASLTACPLGRASLNSTSQSHSTGDLRVAHETPAPRGLLVGLPEAITLISALTAVLKFSWRASEDDISDTSSTPAMVAPER